MAKKLSLVGWIGSFLITIALINWGSVAWFNFNLVTWMTFGVMWLAKVIYTIVAVLGLWGLGELLTKTFK